MKKRKATGRKTAKKKPALTAKPLRDLGREALQNLPDSPHVGFFGFGMSGASKQRTEIAGVPIPPDLEKAVSHFSWKRTNDLIALLRNPPIIRTDSVLEDYVEAFEAIDLENVHVAEIQSEMTKSMRQGFYLALLRYADELKHVPEAAALLEAKRRGAKKGGDARRKQAAPNHKAIRQRFKALRKATPKKTVRYLRVAEEFGMSDRHVARIVDGID